MRSIVEVSREAAINDQSIKNRIKKSGSGIFTDGSREWRLLFLTPKERYQLQLKAAGTDCEQAVEFLRERGLHSQHLMVRASEVVKNAHHYCSSKPVVQR